MTQNYEERVRFANHEIIERGNLAVVDEVFTADYVVHTGGKDFRGTEFVRRFIGQLRSAISDLQVVKIEYLLQTGDTLAWERTLSGTHSANMMGIPPTGKTVVWRDMLVSRFDGGMIAEEWAVSELAGQLFSKFS